MIGNKSFHFIFWEGGGGGGRFQNWSIPLRLVKLWNGKPKQFFDFLQRVYKMNDNYAQQRSYANLLI